MNHAFVTEFSIECKPASIESEKSYIWIVVERKETNNNGFYFPNATFKHKLCCIFSHSQGKIEFKIFCIIERKTFHIFTVRGYTNIFNLQNLQ